MSYSIDMFEHTPGDCEGQESLVCCSPWGRKELDMIEWLNCEVTVFPRSVQCLFLIMPTQRTSISSVQFSCSVLSNSLRPRGMLHTRLPCPSPTLRAHSNSCPSSWWCHPTISSYVVLFSSCLQSFSASGSFPMNQFFESGGQSIGVSASASVLPMNIQDWFPLGLTGLISL